MASTMTVPFCTARVVSPLYIRPVTPVRLSHTYQVSALRVNEAGIFCVDKSYMSGSRRLGYSLLLTWDNSDISLKTY